MKDDTISRRAALDALGERPMLWVDDDNYTLGARNQYDSNRLAIETVPSVDAVPVVHGRWKAVTEDMVTYKRICSCCGKEAPYDMRDEDPLSEGYYMLYPYCPWCGAKMEDKKREQNRIYG